MKGRVAAALALASALAVSLGAQGTRLEVSGKPRLINCGGNPCFRIEVNAVDAQGQPSPLDDNAQFAVSLNGEPVEILLKRRFLRTVTSGSAPAAGRRRISLVLFDTSGSMNQRLPTGGTKFTAAKGQLERLFATLQEGVDQMAIVPFDSARVAERIQGASFETSKEGIRRQVAALEPRAKGNTALYSAVYEGLQKLQPFTSEDAQITLIVFTDGANDVDHPGDDPGLLSGAAGLQKVTALAREVGITIYTIGYGAPGVAFDQASLQALKFPQGASNYFNARDEARLVQIFNTIARRGGTTVTLLVGPLPMRREQLPASLTFEVASGRLRATAPSWDRNPLMTSPFEGTMNEEEQKAWLNRTLRPPGGAGPAGVTVPSYIMRLVVLASYSAVLAALWFGLPRLLWPDRYIPKPAARPAPARPQRPGAAPRPGMPPPAPGRAQPARPEPPRAGPRPPSRSPQPQPPAERPRPAAPRGREVPHTPTERPRENWGPRDPGDATVFIPPSKKPGGPS